MMSRSLFSTPRSARPEVAGTTLPATRRQVGRPARGTDALLGHKHLPSEAALSRSSMEPLPMAIKTVLLGRPAGKSGRSAIEGNSDATDGAKPSTYRTSRWVAARITLPHFSVRAVGIML